MRGRKVKIIEYVVLTGIHDHLWILWEHGKTNTSNGRSPWPRDLGRSLGETTESNRSLVQRIPTDYGLPVCVISKPQQLGGLGPSRVVAP